MGAGRSGSTLLGVTLGNDENIFFPGELFKFPILKGDPHGFSKESQNFKYWQKIKASFFAKQPNSNFEELDSLSKKVEEHRNVIANLFHLKSKKTYQNYSNYINDFLTVLFENRDEDIIVDSSKFVGRALALNRFCKYDTYFIHLKRSPVGVVNSFAKQNIEQPSRGFVSANFYYFTIHLLGFLVEMTIPKRKLIKIKLEDFQNHPEKSLKAIENKFNIDLQNLISKVENNEELYTDNIFEGNRIRLQKAIKIKAPIINKPTLKDRISSLINIFWYK